MAQILYPDELQTPELALEFLEYAPHQLLRVPTYFFRMIDPSTQDGIGRINLRATNAELVVRYAGHIDYEVAEQHRGHRLASHAVELLKPLAWRLGLDPLWITCNPDNFASRRTCELAGGEFIETIAVPVQNPMCEGGAREKCRYRLELQGRDDGN
jgi:tagatose 1,6-diphosphate aldolase